MTVLDPLFQRLGIDAGDVAGASVSGEIPIRDSLINRLIASRLAGHPHIAGVDLAAQDGDVIVARIQPRLRMLPSLTVTARIERQPELPDNPILWLRWSVPAVGPLALAAGPIMNYLKATPPGIRVERDTLAIDIRELLRTRGLEHALTLVRRAAVHTRVGVVVVQFDAKL